MARSRRHASLRVPATLLAPLGLCMACDVSEGQSPDARLPGMAADAAPSAPRDAKPISDAAPPEPGDAAPPPPVDAGGPKTKSFVRFVVLGDGGTGAPEQKKVASAIRDVCAERGCDFALYLGDNIYDSGSAAPDDQQFVDKFEQPYAELAFPFYVVLGNHDYGDNGTNLFLFEGDARSAAQVEYTAHSQTWNMPHYYYSFREHSVAFFGLDTNAIVVDRYRTAAEQAAWLEAELAKSDARWKIVFGHHPYVSNGDHGNAGAYAGGPLSWEPHDGALFKALVESTICGKAQVYFAGHDHNREWLEPTCGTSFLVSGAAAKLRAMENHGSPTRWNDGEKLGFLWVEIVEDRLTGVFYDAEGAIDYEDVIERAPG